MQLHWFFLLQLKGFTLNCKCCEATLGSHYDAILVATYYHHIEFEVFVNTHHDSNYEEVTQYCFQGSTFISIVVQIINSLVKIVFNILSRGRSEQLK